MTGSRSRRVGFFARAGLALAAMLAATACSPTPNILPTNDLNRPTDIAFMCLGAFQNSGGTYDVSGRPMRVCRPLPDVDRNRVAPPGAALGSRTFAFVSNSASGDLSVIDGDSWKLVDLDKATGGFGRAPIGTLPEQISASTDGCRLMSANRGSCDLSLIDPSQLLASTLASQFNSDTVTVNVPLGNGIQRIVPMRGDGMPLGAAPYEALFLPVDTTGMDQPGAPLCPANGSWHALVTFPSCNLVALIDLPSGNILSSATVTAGTDANGLATLSFVDAGTSPVCAAECGSGGRTATADAGAPDAGGGAGAPRPTSIAITPRGDQAYVSFSNVPAILSLVVSPTGLASGAKAGGIQLHDGAVGSNRIRLGVDPYAFKNALDFPGKFVGDDENRAYLYVIARDGSLRIVDVFLSMSGDEVECETNFDPLNNPKLDLSTVADQRCIPYGTVNRRPNSADATSGLRFPSVPIDVAAADIERETQDEDTVLGGYAWVLTSGGPIYLINITPAQRSIKAVVHQDQTVLFDPNPAQVSSYIDNPFVYLDGTKTNANMPNALVQEPPPIPNRPRDRNINSYSTALDPTLGLPRLDVPPVELASGPYIEPLWTQGTEQDATALDPGVRQTSVFFPDREAAVQQSWDVIWQGSIISPRYSGTFDPNDSSVLVDNGGAFCSNGVLAGDIVTLNGCTADTQCPLGMVCLQDPTLDQVPGGLTVTGLCVAQNLRANLANQCAALTGSVRRYEIVEASESGLRLTPHLDEIVRSSLCPCRIGNETSACGASTTGGTTGTGGMGGAAGMGGAGGAAGTGGTTGTGGNGATNGGAGFGGPGCAPTNDCFDPTDGSSCTFECVDLPATGRRCLNKCTKDQDCRHGRICLPYTICSAGDISHCPTGTTACVNSLCTTDVMCDSSTPCGQNQTCGDAKRCVFNVESYCADGPPLTDRACFPQLTPYQVNANASFLVSGSVSGSLLAGRPNQTTGLCEPDPTRDGRLVGRIPLRPAPGGPDVVCGPDGPAVLPKNQTTDPIADGYFFDHFDPDLKPKLQPDMPGKLARVDFGSDPNLPRPEAPQLVQWMNAWTKDITAPNACLYLGGPVQTDSDLNDSPLARMTRPQHVRARFRNTQIAFVLANIDRGPPASSTIHFDVHGGFRPQSVLVLPTVEISAPARLVLSPIDSNQVTTITMKPVPFFFVVDQRRLGTGQGGGATRGQILRVNPFGQPSSISGAYLPAYEDYQRSGGLFPIQ